MNLKLTIDLVPQPVFGVNLRLLLPPGRWDVLRRLTYARVGYRCEICGGKGARHPVECHEQWHYDDFLRIAVLTGLHGLCPLCHKVKHVGLALEQGHYHVIDHFCRVNGISRSIAENLIEEAFLLWEERSCHDWSVDVNWLFQGR